MATTMAAVCAVPCAVPFVGQARPASMGQAVGLPRLTSAPKGLPSRTTRPALRRSRAPVQPKAAMEVFQLAGEGAEIGGYAAVMFAITLVGLAVGFVLLRVEALVEEGKI